MKDAKNKGTGGFSLVEVLAAITVLGLIAAPIGASLVMSHRINARSHQLMQAQLAVSSTVETLMAEGIEPSELDPATDIYRESGDQEVKILATRKIRHEDGSEEESAAYQVTVTSGDVTVVTFIRPAPPSPLGSEGETEGGEPHETP